MKIIVVGRNAILYMLHFHSEHLPSHVQQWSQTSTDWPKEVDCRSAREKVRGEAVYFHSSLSLHQFKVLHTSVFTSHLPIPIIVGDTMVGRVEIAIFHISILWGYEIHVNPRTVYSKACLGKC